MTQKVSFRRAIIALITLGLALTPVVISTAQSPDRPILYINSLLTASTYETTVGEAVRFEINRDVVLLLASQNLLAVSWDFGDETLLRSTVISDREHVYTEPGIYTARVELIAFEKNFTSTVLITVYNKPAPSPFDPIVEDIANFDVNNNNLLGDIEFFLIVDAWVAGEVSDETFFAAVDIWVGNDTITSILSSSAATLTPMATPAGPNTMIFSAAGAAAGAGAPYTQLAVQVFNANGELIFSDQRTGNQLRWNLRDRSGALVANGTYFYVMTAVNQQNQPVPSVQKALVVLRTDHES